MSKIQVSKTSIEGLLIIEPKCYLDSRGCFMETYNKESYKAAGILDEFVQDNISKSVKNVLRGMHYQKKYPQAKIVSVLEGSIFDVAVDLRHDSATYGKWYGVELSGENCKQLYIPTGFAHGFLVLSDAVIFSYKCSEFYHPEDEAGIRWDDPSIGIKWPVHEELIISEKDMNWSMIKNNHEV